MLVVRQPSVMQKEWATGVSDNPKNFGVKIISHEKTQAHLDASIAFGRWKAGQRIDRVQLPIDTEATFWRNDFRRIINIVKSLAMAILALRGDHEHAGDSDCHGGNFVALNRQGPQMRYFLWAPECDATPLAAVHIILCLPLSVQANSANVAAARLMSKQ